MNQGDLIKTGIALGIVWAIYKFAPGAAIKAAALGVAGTIVARQVPFVKDAIS
jgi:xanthosine utilization system XapX-like protein